MGIVQNCNFRLIPGFFMHSRNYVVWSRRLVKAVGRQVRGRPMAAGRSWQGLHVCSPLVSIVWSRWRYRSKKAPGPSPTGSWAAGRSQRKPARTLTEAHRNVHLWYLSYEVHGVAEQRKHWAVNWGIIGSNSNTGSNFLLRLLCPRVVDSVSSPSSATCFS